jgi:hypothetical protein
LRIAEGRTAGMKRIAMILATAVAGLASLCAGLLTYGYLVYADMPERAFRSQGPNAAWAEQSWVNAIQDSKTYGRFAALLRRNRITDVYFYMGWPEANGTIPSDRYAAAPILLREMRAQYPALRLHAWIEQVETRGGGILDLSDADVRRNVASTARHFLALGFDGIHYGFPAAGSGNAHLLMLLDQTRILTRGAHAALSIDADPLEPVPGLAWLARKTGSQNGYWTRRYYQRVVRRVDQIAVVPAGAAMPVRWLAAGLIAWQTRTIRPLTAGHATLFMGIPSHDDGPTAAATSARLVGPTLVGIRKGMSALRDDPFTDFGVALDLGRADGADAGNGDRALLGNWLDAGDLVVR